MPRFLKIADSEILAASFELSDAQDTVARQHGFDSWQALKTGLSTTSRKVNTSPSKVTIVNAEPQLFIANIKRSCEFFCKKLGFSLVFSYADPPYYAQVGRDAARLNLRIGSDLPTVPARSRNEVWESLGRARGAQLDRD